jgi:aspartokinase
MSRNLPDEPPVTVIKIGGSILTSTKGYRRAAIFVRNRHRAPSEEKLVVVLSAEEDATDQLARAGKKSHANQMRGRSTCCGQRANCALWHCSRCTCRRSEFQRRL